MYFDNEVKQVYNEETNGKRYHNSIVSKPKERVEDNNIIYQIKPEFNMLYKFLSNSWRAIIYLFLICFVFTHIYKLWFEYPVSLIITIFAMLIYVVVKMILENMQYDELEYNFYATKVEYTDGFINKE